MEVYTTGASSRLMLADQSESSSYRLAARLLFSPSLFILRPNAIDTRFLPTVCMQIPPLLAIFSDRVMSAPAFSLSLTLPESWFNSVMLFEVLPSQLHCVLFLQ